MRIVDREDFMAMPEGTLFQHIDKHGTAKGLLVKWKTISNDGANFDWYEQDFDTIDAENCWEENERRGEMMMEGKSYPLSSIIGRDGLFDKEQLFLVMEKDDVRLIKESVDYAWNVVND